MSNSTMRSHRKDDKRDNKRIEAAWAIRVKARDLWRCRMERWSERRQQWEEHGISGSPDNPLMSAHCYGRSLIEPVKFDDAVGITACKNCHDRFDKRTFKGPAVRVPEAREEAAYAVIEVGVTMWTVPRKLPPARPEAA